MNYALRLLDLCALDQKSASKTKGMAFGNIVFGGVIGAGVDMADGAAYDYPNEINMNLNKKA